MVLVVVERPGDLFLEHFWLITSLDGKRYPAEKRLALYRKTRQGGGPHGRVDGRARPGAFFDAPTEA